MEPVPAALFFGADGGIAMAMPVIPLVGSFFILERLLDGFFCTVSIYINMCVYNIMCVCYIRFKVIV